MSMQTRTNNVGATSPANIIGGTGQSLEQTHNIVGAVRNQPYPGSLSGLTKNGMNNNNGNMGATNLVMRPQHQRSSSFAIPGQQIRTVGDFQALQRANSDMSSLSPLGLNSLGADLDFSALR